MYNPLRQVIGYYYYFVIFLVLYVIDRIIAQLAGSPLPSFNVIVITLTNIFAFE